MTKNERDRRKDMPALTAGDIFMGGYAGSAGSFVILAPLPIMASDLI